MEPTGNRKRRWAESNTDSDATDEVRSNRSGFFGVQAVVGETVSPTPPKVETHSSRPPDLIAALEANQDSIIQNTFPPFLNPQGPYQYHQQLPNPATPLPYVPGSFLEDSDLDADIFQGDEDEPGTGQPITWANLDFEGRTIIIKELTDQWGSFDIACEQLGLGETRLNQWLARFRADRNDLHEWETNKKNWREQGMDVPDDYDGPGPCHAFISSSTVYAVQRCLEGLGLVALVDRVEAWKRRTVTWPPKIVIDPTDLIEFYADEVRHYQEYEYDDSFDEEEEEVSEDEPMADGTSEEDESNGSNDDYSGGEPSCGGRRNDPRGGGEGGLVVVGSEPGSPEPEDLAELRRKPRYVPADIDDRARRGDLGVNHIDEDDAEELRGDEPRGDDNDDEDAEEDERASGRPQTVELGANEEDDEDEVDSPEPVADNSEDDGDYVLDEDSSEEDFKPRSYNRRRTVEKPVKTTVPSRVGMKEPAKAKAVALPTVDEDSYDESDGDTNARPHKHRYSGKQPVKAKVAALPTIHEENSDGTDGDANAHSHKRSHSTKQPVRTSVPSHSTKEPVKAKAATLPTIHEDKDNSDDTDGDINAHSHKRRHSVKQPVKSKAAALPTIHEETSADTDGDISAHPHKRRRAVKQPIKAAIPSGSAEESVKAKRVVLSADVQAKPASTANTHNNIKHKLSKQQRMINEYVKMGFVPTKYATSSEDSNDTDGDINARPFKRRRTEEQPTRAIIPSAGVKDESDDPNDTDGDIRDRPFSRRYTVKQPVKAAAPSGSVKQPIKAVVPSGSVKQPIKAVVPSGSVKQPIKAAVPSPAVGGQPSNNGKDANTRPIQRQRTLKDLFRAQFGSATPQVIQAPAPRAPRPAVKRSGPMLARGPTLTGLLPSAPKPPPPQQQQQQQQKKPAEPRPASSPAYKPAVQYPVTVYSSAPTPRGPLPSAPKPPKPQQKPPKPQQKPQPKPPQKRRSRSRTSTSPDSDGRPYVRPYYKRLPPVPLAPAGIPKAMDRPDMEPKPHWRRAPEDRDFPGTVFDNKEPVLVQHQSKHYFARWPKMDHKPAQYEYLARDLEKAREELERLVERGVSRV